MNLNKWWQENGFMTLVVCAVIFFILLFLFRDRIQKYFSDKTDFEVTLSTKRPTKRLNGKKNESKCREIFEKIFQKPFPTVRPEFLRRSNNKKLEIDGYNQELKLGFEYQGRQHYEYTPVFHKSINDFYNQQQRDIEKRTLCKKHGVIIIEIPYTIKYTELEKYIRQKLLELKNIYSFQQSDIF